MAGTKKAKEYSSKAVISKISAVSRMSVKIKESYYTLEYAEERIIPAEQGVDIVKEREMLWDTVNAEVDKQVEDVCKMFKK